MKRADIRTRVVYGYNESQSRHYRYDAVLVLSTGLYMRRRHGNQGLTEPADKYHTTIKSGRNFLSDSTGLLTVFLGFSAADPEYDRKLDRLLSLVTPETALEAMNSESENQVIYDGIDAQSGEPVRLGHYALITSQRYLHGEYRQLQSELDEADRKRVEYDSLTERERIAAVALHNSLADRLDKLGLTGYHVQQYESPGSRMKLKVTDLEALLDLAEHAYADNIRP